MLDLNRAVALALLAFSSGYAYLAFTYHLLPFEYFLPVRPNTLPLALAVGGIICSLALLIKQSTPENDIKGDGTVNRADGEYLKNPQNYNWIQGIVLLVLATFYALGLRSLGFLFCTFAFLTLGGILLGERRYTLLISISFTASILVWYLVDHVLTIFLRPWPAWFY
jgi:putative tricarboxylic transport membrane protein|tara:strand:- start:71 stop:571 length:501 start_codon:yes stop_codon:yes gene_type:complete